MMEIHMTLLMALALAALPQDPAPAGDPAWTLTIEVGNV